MIGLDTNVLVRYLAGDPDAEAQTLQAIALVDGAFARQEKCFVNIAVLCETAWVLLYHYTTPKAALTESLAQLLAHPGFVFEHPALLRAALAQYRDAPVDFADCIIDRLNRHHGCRQTVSFDKQAISALGFIQP